jgi:hypothetical protein
MESIVRPVVDRRRAKRTRHIAEHGILLARVRPGHDASVVDVSAHGALVETAHRLLPGRHIELHLETLEARTAIRGRVLRCSVAGVLASRVSYRGAIGFDLPLSWLADGKGEGYSVLRPLGIVAPQL